MVQLSSRKLSKFISRVNIYFLCSWLIWDSPSTLLKVCFARIKELLLKASYKNVCQYVPLYCRTQQLTVKCIYYSQDFFTPTYTGWLILFWVSQFRKDSLEKTVSFGISVCILAGSNEDKFLSIRIVLFIKWDRWHTHSIDNDSEILSVFGIYWFVFPS